MTTVGYGDITPVRPVACIEAVIGQIYVAVIVAELISMKVSAAFNARPADAPR